MDHATLYGPVDGQGPCGWANWLLPVSKTDVRALGKNRALACACPAPGCPVWHMRRIVAVSSAARISARACARPWPLIINGTGGPMSKADVVAFYKAVSELAGDTAIGISGHSARVTGAMRMAAAGHPAWTIQVFGRWGSAAVLGYVREAILGERGGSLAATTEARSLTISKLKKRLAVDRRRQPFRACRIKRAAALVAVTERALRPSRDLLAAASSGAGDVVHQLAGRIRKLEANMHILSGEACPDYVECSGGRRHRVVSSTRTACGWAWKMRGGSPVLSEPSGNNSSWCKKCLTGR